MDLVTWFYRSRPVILHRRASSDDGFSNCFGNKNEDRRIGSSRGPDQGGCRIPEALEDLDAFVARVEAIPVLVYEGLVRNASFREDQLGGLSYLDTMDSGR